MLPMAEGRIGNAKGHAAGPNHAAADQGRVAQAGPLLLGLEPLRIGLLVGEAQRVGRLKLSFPFLEGAFVQKLIDPLSGTNVPVVIAFGADAQQLLRLLAIDHRLAAGTALPQPLRHTALRPLARHVGPARGGVASGGFYFTSGHVRDGLETIG